MSILSWFESLNISGHAKVDSYQPLEAGELQSLQTALLAWEDSWRQELCFVPPELHFPCFLWSAVTLYRACQFLVYREIDATVVKNELSVPYPGSSDPSAHYSVDICFRYLPDLVRLSRGVAEGDPLVQGLLALATAWPLSSVGVRGVPQVDVSGFIDHPSLRRLYADRIINIGDSTRLSDSKAHFAVREAIGERFDLVPAGLAAALNKMPAIKECSFNE